MNDRELQEVIDSNRDVVPQLCDELQEARLADVPFGSLVNIADPEGFRAELKKVLHRRNAFERMNLLTRLLVDRLNRSECIGHRVNKLKDQIRNYGRDDANEGQNAKLLKAKLERDCRTVARQMQIIVELFFKLRRDLLLRVLKMTKVCKGGFSDGDEATRKHSYRYDIRDVLEDFAYMDKRFRDCPNTNNNGEKLHKVRSV